MSNNIMSDSKEKNRVKSMYQLLYDFDKLLFHYKIDYFLILSSLLGAVKVQGILSTDTDISIGMTYKNSQRFKNLYNVFKKLDYIITDTDYGYQILSKNTELNILQFSKYKDKYAMKNKLYRELLPRECYTFDQIKNIQNVDFANYRVKVPGNPQDYLVKTYTKEQLNEKKLKIATPYDSTNMDHEHIKKLCTLEPQLNIDYTKFVYMLHKSPSINKLNSDNIWNTKSQFDTSIGVYVINCKRDSKRLQKFTNFANAANLKFKIENCVNGSKFTQQTLCDMREEKLLHPKSEMNSIEIAINLSHLNVWTRVVTENYKYGLIIEDDCEVHEDFVSTVNKLVNGLESININFNVLHLWNGNWMNTKSSQKYVTKIENYKIYREIKEYNAGAVCYIFSNSFCRYMMKKMFPIRMPQDLFVGDHYKIGIHLTLKMKHDKIMKCQISPILESQCDEIHGTGLDSTQTRNAILINQMSCKKCDKV